jgi:hypothetical protein
MIREKDEVTTYLVARNLKDRTMPYQADAQITLLRNDFEKLKSLLTRTMSSQVKAKSITDGSRRTVKDYFENIRPMFTAHGLDNDSLGGLDALMQEYLVLTQRAALKKTYLQKIKSINQELNGVEVALLTVSSTSMGSNPQALDGKEMRIAQTIVALVPSAGASYEQACLDLRGPERLSYRGAAAELRESLRESLDHLAPDKFVMEQNDFKPENGQTKPTMRQKVRYILASRGKSRSITETPENAVQVVEERVGALARSVYKRSSLSTHVGTTKQEVQQVKAYVDVVLSELLEIA